MKRVLFAIAVSMLASCAGPRAYSGATSSAQSTETKDSQSSDSANSGAGSAEPSLATYMDQVFSTDEVENQRRAFEAWEAGGG